MKRPISFMMILSLLFFCSSTSEAKAMGCPDSQAVINTTNTYRKWHQAPPYIWNKKLANESSAYADILAKDCGLVHSPGALTGKYGENLYSVVSYPKPLNTCKIAVDVWYGEVSRYNFKSKQPLKENWPKGVGHFTALVWKGSTSFGCGMAISNIKPAGFSLITGCKVIACRYLPSGNVGSDAAFLANVLPKK
jgi:uncharacterized protein YkwD